MGNLENGQGCILMCNESFEMGTGRWMGITSAICLPNDPVATAIISVRNWQAGNCSQPLWRIGTIKVLVNVTAFHRPSFSLSESLKHAGDTGSVTDSDFQCLFPSPWPLYPSFCVSFLLKPFIPGYLYLPLSPPFSFSHEIQAWREGCTELESAGE